MTKLLEHAFDEARKLPPQRQDEFASFLLAELADEQRWVDAFAQSQPVLELLAQEARDELRTGTTLPMEGDPDDPKRPLLGGR